MTPAQINALGETILARYERIVNDIFVEHSAVTGTELDLLLKLQGMAIQHFVWVKDRCRVKVYPWTNPSGLCTYIWTKKEAISES